MAELPNISEMSLQQLQRLTQSDPFKNAPFLYQQRAFTRLRELREGARAGETVAQTMDPEVAQRLNQTLQAEREAEATRERVRAEQTARQIREAISEQPPAAPPPATPSPEDLTSQAMRAVLPPPTLPQGPVVPPDVEQPPGGSRAPVEAPPSAPPAPPQPAPSSGMRAAPTQVGESGEARRARAMGETAELMKGLQEPERKPSIMDSPYTAIINAGLNMLMNAAGRSPLEAIAMGAGAGLKTAQEQAMREEARGEKKLERAYKRAEMGVKLRTDLQRVEQEEEKLRAEYEKIKNQRENYANEATHRAAMLAIQERLAAAGEERNAIQDRLANVREQGQSALERRMQGDAVRTQISSINQRITALQREKGRAITPQQRQEIDDDIAAAQAELRGHQEELARILGTAAPRPAPAPVLPTQRVR